MKERPILFTGPMARALLDGRKTQTRRILKPQPSVIHASHADGSISTNLISRKGDGRIHCPYGAPGDRLWVKENYQYADWTEDGEPYVRYQADGSDRLVEAIPEDWEIKLMKIWETLSDPANYAMDGRAADRKWRPSIFMPRWASRILLEIVSVRVERLNSISRKDAIAEGLKACRDDHWVFPDTPQDRAGICHSDPDIAYSYGWDMINGEGSWESDPWVWVVEFKRL